MSGGKLLMHRFKLVTIRVGDEGWLASGSDYRAVCTSVGVIVNSAADARLSETVAATMLSGRFAAPEHG